MCLLHRCSLVSRFTLFHKFTVFEAVSSNENIENGFCFSVFGSSNSATCHMEQLVSIRWHNINLCIFGVVTCPLSMTRRRSACITVLSRWAFVSIVLLRKASWMVFWIRASVSASMEAVASSKRMICTTRGQTISISKNSFRGQHVTIHKTPILSKYKRGD